MGGIGKPVASSSIFTKTQIRNVDTLSPCGSQFRRKNSICLQDSVLNDRTVRVGVRVVWAVVEQAPFHEVPTRLAHLATLLFESVGKTVQVIHT